MTSASAPRDASLDARLARFAALRRALARADAIEAVAAETTAFARDALGATSAAVYVSPREEDDFSLVVGPGTTDLPPEIDRASPFVVELEAARGEPERARELGAMWGVDVAAGAWQGERLVGVLLLTGDVGDALIDELQFELERALGATVMAMLREEELAVLAVQERELVGLLREVQERDALIRADLERARDFQRHMLGAPPTVRGAEVHVTFEPLELVGGDLYAVSSTDDVVRVFVADATGHGVRACLTTMFIKSEYEIARGAPGGPARVLAELNDAIAKKYRSAEMLFAATCADIDVRSGIARVAFAGCPPASAVRGGRGELLGGGGPLMGLRPRMRFEVAEIELAQGDGLYLYTDGYVEAREAGGEQFGDERAAEAIAAAHASGGDGTLALERAVAAFLRGGKKADDATSVGVRLVDPEALVPAPPVSLR